MERRILLAHEDADCRRIYRIALEFGGWTVVDTSDAASALELLRSQSFDAIVTDVFVHGRQGRALLHDIRAMPSLARTPIVVLTGWSTAEHELKALRDGADVFLVMPVTPQSLLLTLDGLIDPSLSDERPPSPPRDLPPVPEIRP